MSHLSWVQNSPNNFDLDPQPWPTILNIDLWPWPLKSLTLIHDLKLWPLWPWPLWPWTTISDTKLKTEIFTFLMLVTLTFYLWPWPSNSSEIWWSLICVPMFGSVGPMVQSAECKQTHTQTDGWTLPKILPLPLRQEAVMVDSTIKCYTGRKENP